MVQDKYSGNDIIWQYWHQGEENAPMLIKKCFESVRRHMPNHKQIILSYDTIKDYVELPQRYYKLFEEGKIKMPLFSDLLRIYLLTKYGGTWVDSTIYLTDKIPDDIMDSNFFVFQKSPKTDVFEDKMSSFFYHTKNYSEHLAILKNVFDSYWEENDFLIHYFMIEHVSSMLSDRTPTLKAEWDAIPYYSMHDAGVMQAHIFDKYTEEGWNKFKELTSIHKLSYKIIRDKTSGESYYDYIILN